MVWIVDTVVVACSNFCNFRYHYHGELDDILKIQRAKSLQNSWEKLKKSNCLVTAELKKHILTIFSSWEKWPICAWLRNQKST